VGLNHKVEIYKPVQAKNPMNRLDMKYDHLLTSERLQKKVWMLIALGGMCYVIASLFLFKYAIELPKSIPMVIEVSSWGEAKNMGDLSHYSYDTLYVPESARKWQVKDFIKKLRTISADRDIVYENVTNIFSMITSKCAQQVKYDLKNPDIFSFIGKKTISISFESIIKVSDDSYQVDWNEKTIGSNAGNRRYRGIFTISLLNPSEKQAEINPLGIYINAYDITEIKEQ